MNATAQAARRNIERLLNQNPDGTLWPEICRLEAAAVTLESFDAPACPKGWDVVEPGPEQLVQVLA